MLEQKAFWMERLHRTCAYVFIFIVPERHFLVWLILATGILFDILDSIFRRLSIRDRQAALQAPQNDIENQIDSTDGSEPVISTPTN